MINHKNVAGAGNNRYLLGSGTFDFDCHCGVPCFTRCCHDADMYLYPYDILRMKQRLAKQLPVTLRRSAGAPRGGPA